MEQISTLDGTIFPEDIKQIICFLETSVPEQNLSCQYQQDGSGEGTLSSLVCSV